jgi:hypothetical protein
VFAKPERVMVMDSPAKAHSPPAQSGQRAPDASVA